jgi:hypothetical protein
MPPVVFLALSAVAGGLAASGVVAGLTILGTSLTGLLVNLAISFALSGILGLIAGNNASRPAAQKQNIKQAIPPRRRSDGRVKIGGVYAFLNDKNSYLHIVFMLTQGEIDAFEEHWFGSDLLTLSGANVTSPQRFVWKSTHYAQVRPHTGTDTQAADATLTGDWAGVLDSNFRLLGVAYTYLKLLSPKPQDFTKVYPAGVPEYNAVMRACKVWDPRDGAQDPDDPTTWTWTQNAALIILDYLWHRDGMRLPRYLLEAAVDTWKLQATACDTDRVLEDLTVEPWYRLSGQYQLTDPPKQVLPLMLEPIDGRLGMRPDGAIIVDVGQWQPPDIWITDRDIYTYSMMRGRQASDVRNEFRAQYVAPENDYIATEAQPYQNTASIAVDGIQALSMDLSWAPSHAQARYRLKVEAGRHDAQRWNGQVVSNAYGMKFMTSRADGTRRRTINIQIAELGIDETFEVQRYDFDVRTGRCTFSVTAMGFSDYGWNASTDQGTAPASPADIVPDPVEDPQNLVASVVTATVSGGIETKFISASVDAPTQPNLQLVLAYRTHDGLVTDANAIWTDMPLDGDLSGHTGTLPDGGLYDVRATFVDPQGNYSNDVYQRSIAVGYTGSLPPISVGTVQASQTLTAGDFVNLHTVTGALRMRKADATDATKQADGFVKSAVTSGNSDVIYGPGQVNDSLSGLTPGSAYYLSTTAGQATATAPSTTGNLVQHLGKALSATNILFDPYDAVQL